MVPHLQLVKAGQEVSHFSSISTSRECQRSFQLLRWDLKLCNVLIFSFVNH